jgi:serine/threonine protein kinase
LLRFSAFKRRDHIMTSDLYHWDRLQALFHLAEEFPNTDLDELLSAACDDPILRARAKTLIETGRRPAAAAGLAGAPALSAKIGPYTIVRYLGSGGIGTVYLVERVVGGAVQRVALKMLTRSAAGPMFTERFAREQHILASLEHANITRMLDAGMSEEGHPFLVMEYVDGVPLDIYCDERSLGVPERIELFLQICEAIAYAHRNLVVHLDLKPSNVLVSAAEGAVKVLDFGTSKLIQPDSLLTTTVMATPAYASPEQLLNQPVTTVCDVYALGAILFELLSGRRPNQDSSVALLIERSLKEFPPEPVAQAVTGVAAEHRGMTETRLRSLLSGDLATIIAKCLNPRPKDRYATVDALMADLRRYQAGRPVLARPQTTTYRIGKFVRRNRALVTASSLAATALATVLGYAALQQREALREARRSLQMQTFLSELFRLANSKYLGKPKATVPEFLQLGVRVLPDFIRDAADQRAAQLSLAESMFQNGDYLHAGPVFSQLVASAKAAGDVGQQAESEAYAGDIAYLTGDVATGNRLTADALALSRERGVTPAARVWIEDSYASNRENLGTRTDENIRLLQAAVQETRSSHLPERLTAVEQAKLAGFLEQRGRLKDAEPLLKEASDIFAREPYALCDRSETLGDLAYVRGAQGDLLGSVTVFRQAYDGLSTCAGAGSRETLMMQAHLASAMLKTDQAKAVAPMLEASMPAWRTLSGSGVDLANPLIFLAKAYMAAGDFPRAERTAEELFAVQDGKVSATSYRMGVSQLVWAQALAAQHRNAEARPHAEMAVKAFSSETTPTAAQKQTKSQAEHLLADIPATEAHGGRQKK